MKRRGRPQRGASAHSHERRLRSSSTAQVVNNQGQSSPATYEEIPIETAAVLLDIRNNEPQAHTDPPAGRLRSRPQVPNGSFLAQSSSDTDENARDSELVLQDLSSGDFNDLPQSPVGRATVTTSYLQAPEQFADLRSLDLEPEYDVQVLIRNFANPSSLGIFCILPEFALGSEHDDPSAINWVSLSLPPEVLCILLAIGLQLELADPCAVPRDNAKLTIDTLRIEALKHIPVLTWISREMRLSQAISLVLASHTWCMQTFLIEISTAWNSLASIIWKDVHRRHLRLGVGPTDDDLK